MGEGLGLGTKEGKGGGREGGKEERGGVLLELALCAFSRAVC